MDLTDEFTGGSMIGRRIGVYRLVDEIGRGGMGTVYRATRVDGEFRQTVAIKLIKRGMDTDLILTRFRRERQILASLNHPNIASFLGGGSTDEGLPYFVMEFINGKPLYEFCNASCLDLKERLRIFREVCYAVIAAHRSQIVHRDIKPSNILVRTDRKPKLLDFGIAKVLDSDLMQTEVEPTATQLRVMTPEYASPEQMSGGEIGPASDIYSLGVILYELLTGHRPYRLRRRAYDESARIVREEEPYNPSSSLTHDEFLYEPRGSEASLERVLQERRSSLESLHRELSGDIDKIVLKALRKDAAERYDTAADLANDITNYLEGRPVKAEFHVTLRNIPRQAQRAPSIGILPFKMVGDQKAGDTGDEFLGIGLADTLISRLSGLQRLIVRPTSSVLPFAASEPFDAAGKLDVDFVLDGNIRRAGERMRISVQLLEVADRSTRWAKAFDSSVKDVIQLEDTIADQVVSSLLPQLTSDERQKLERRGTNDPAAYQAYLRGRYFWSRFTDEYLLKAVDAFSEAIELDPHFALPYIGLADFYIWSAIFGEIPSTVGFPKAQEAARRALEIDDSLGEAYAVLAFSVFLHSWNWDDAEYLIKRALELSPNHPFAHECFSNFLTAQGKFDEGLDEIRHAEELDPVSPRALLMTAWTMYQARKFPGSAEKAKQANNMQANFPQGMLHVGNAQTALNETSDAVAILRESSRLWPDSGMPLYLLCFALVADGQPGQAREVLDRMLRIAESRQFKPYFVAMAYAALDENDAAFVWFERALEERNEWMIWFGTEPKLDRLRQDPRYPELLRRTNNPLAAGVIDKPSTADTGERERSIAVLPFKRLSSADTGPSDEDYLSVGLADALTMRLSNIRRFLVRPTSSVLPFAGTATDPFFAGQELGVDFIVDGIIRHVGDRIRVTAQLLNVSENSTRWSASFSEKSDDILELEDLISEQVIRSLVPQLTGDECRKLSKRGTNVGAAHDAYLQGRYFWNQFTPEAFQKAIAGFQQAAAADPSYALAYAGIADYYTWACIYGLLPPSEGFPRVFEAASRALQLDPTLAEAHAALGLYYSNMQNWSKADENYRRAIDLNPNYPLAHEWLSALLVGTGRFEEGTTEILLAESLDPLSLRPKVLSAWTIYQTRDFGSGLEKANELIRLDPQFWQGYLQAANCLLELNEGEKALAAAQKAVEIGGESPLPTYTLCFALAAVGNMDAAAELSGRLLERSRSTYIPPYFIALSMIAARETEQAFHHLQLAQDEHSAWMIWFGTEPKLDSMRNDDRYWDLLKQTHNPVIGILRK